jgi:hypothetical protein
MVRNFAPYHWMPDKVRHDKEGIPFASPRLSSSQVGEKSATLLLKMIISQLK